ncbi:MmgE/PrpD family protein [Azospirillum palustre]|uniref:MmgE/PrpD family protein n=1 Tax=Azospirillum palustre TaxID=2044885 RepID=UPI001FCE4388|nr:MmgE/PrpD family protein [Azospirillum palustre]
MTASDNPAILPLASAIARFVAGLTLDSLPPDVVEKARVCLLNGYGIALGGHDTPYAPVARAAALAMHGERHDGGGGGATMLGDGRRTGVPGAALAGSALFHGRAQEDTCGAAHIGAILIPLLTAMVEAGQGPVERLLPALVAGYEAGGLLETAYSPLTTPAGLRASPLYGTVAAAAAAAYLLDLPEDRIAAALANAASFTGGLLQSFDDGTDEWRYQVGVAAVNGLTAAQLAANGSVSAPGAFEGRAGFVRAFARTGCDVAALAAKLGTVWSIRRVTFKPYPVCAFNQTPVTAALALRDELAGRAVRAVTVRMNPFETGYAGMDSKGPFASISGTLMSIPFCIALTLLRGVPTMRTMTRYDDAAVNALVARVDLIADESVARLCCAIEATLDDGTVLTRRQDMTTDDFAFSWDEVGALVRRIGGETGVPSEAYDRIEGFARALPRANIGDPLAAFSYLPHSAR